MKDVKIQVNASAFPDQFASDSVKDSVEFGLQVGQAIQYEWFRRDSGSCRFYSQWGDFNRLRLYARGEQSVSKYKNELAIDGDLSYLNLDWTPVPIIPKFVDIVVNGMNDRMFKVKAVAQDALSAEKRNQYQEMIEGDMLAKPLLQQVEDDFGVIITDGGSTSIESYVYDGFSWVDGGYITYNSGSIFGKPSRLVMIDNENTYVALHGTSRGGVFHFDGSEWSTLWGGGYDHDARGIAAQSENSVWFYGTSWITWYIMHWDGNSVEQFDSQGTMNDIHFFEVQTGWSCGSNNVFRYN